MKKFLIETLLFLIAVFITLCAVFFSVDGYSDPFYIRFTTPTQSSLILGSSRAAQGIQPQIINHGLRRHDMFNYAFTRNDSPYGPTYLNSIRRKLNTETKNGIFIITVDSWSISSDSRDPNDVSSFEELKSSLANTSDVNSDPNISYLFNSYRHPCRNLFLKNKKMFLHDDGWLEINADMQSISTKDINSKINDYRFAIFPFYKYSSARYKYLIETVTYLKKFGTVYLVRLPVHPKMMELDEKLVPGLSHRLKDLSKKYHVRFLDLTPKNATYQYTDGNHLYKTSGAIVTAEIADWISKNEP